MSDKKLRALFENYGAKSVTRTDKNKGAFVLNDAQKAVMLAAGKPPGDGGANAILCDLDVPNDRNGLTLTVSYYNSVRKGAGRTPEARMGRDIVHWMAVGDQICLGNIGSSLFVWKESAPSVTLNEFSGSVAQQADPKKLLAKGRKAKGKPKKLKKEISDFQRSPAVVAGAIARARGLCEMPNCKRDTFLRKDRSVFLEVHHILPLAEGGDDTMENAAALCPTCHRELHYGEEQFEKRKLLEASVKAKEKAS